MPENYPYVKTQNGLIQLLDQLRRKFPSELNSDFVKKHEIAVGNEGALIGTIKFLNLIDENNKPTDEAIRIFTIHDDILFQQSLSNLVKKSYNPLFDTYGDETWILEDSKLITFFRQEDKSTQTVGELKARTFKTLSTYVGHREDKKLLEKKQTKKNNTNNTNKQTRRSSDTSQKTDGEKKDTTDDSPRQKSINKSLNLSVRIEVNLPIADNQETYDKIFKSIRENFLND